MLEKVQKWWRLLKNVRHMNTLLTVVNEGGSATVYAKGRAVTLYETTSGYTVTIALQGDEDNPFSCTYFAWFTEAFDDWVTTANDINNTLRFLDDGTEYMRVL